jgi:hypothetical protein
MVTHLSDAMACWRDVPVAAQLFEVALDPVPHGPAGLEDIDRHRRAARPGMPELVGVEAAFAGVADVVQAARRSGRRRSPAECARSWD